MRESFEAKEDAEKRASFEKKKIEMGEKKPKHHGNIQNYDWKWRECLEYFNNLESSSKVNYTSIAATFDLKDFNGK